jgi:4-hydroxy-tetrahydrodipicolinate synthase
LSNPFQLYAACLSLVDPHEAPLADLIRAHLLWLRANGVQGILVMGTTGEFPHFSVAQRQRYLETVLEVNPGLEVMVNIGAAAKADILALQAHAVAQPGVVKTLWMPPFYYPGETINGLSPLLNLLLEHQPESIPFYIYHFPKMSQVSITPELLAQFPRVAGIKDTSGDFNRIEALVKQFPEKEFYVGTDYEIRKSMDIGCTGVISGMANVFPQLMQDVIQGNTSREALLKQIRETFPAHAKMPGFKAYINLIGLSFQKAVSTLPFADLTDSETDQLVTALEQRLKESLAHVR